MQTRATSNDKIHVRLKEKKQRNIFANKVRMEPKTVIKAEVHVLMGDLIFSRLCGVGDFLLQDKGKQVCV